MNNRSQPILYQGWHESRSDLVETQLRASASDAAAPHARPLPVFLLVLGGYLLCDGGIRLVEVVRYFVSHPSISRVDLQQNLEHVVIATFNLLLFLQILLRTVAARVWGTILFLLHIGILIYHYTVADPEQWLYLSTLGRMQVIARLIFLSAAIVLINHSPNKDALRG